MTYENNRTVFRIINLQHTHVNIRIFAYKSPTYLTISHQFRYQRLSMMKNAIRRGFSKKRSNGSVISERQDSRLFHGAGKHICIAQPEFIVCL